MPRPHVARPSRPVLLTITAALAAIALWSTTVVAPTDAATRLTRVASCAGLNFHPIQSATTFDWSGRALVRAGNVGDGFFLCDPNLPNKATVTSVGFTVVDTSNQAEVRYCALVRSGLAATDSATTAPVALSGMATTGMAETPGLVRASDTTILHATIDTSSFAYWLQCQIRVGPPDVLTTGIIGATVTYTISATNG